MYRNRKATLAYLPDKNMQMLRVNGSSCPFCGLPPEQIIKEYKHFWLVANKFAYHYWEFMNVKEHIMIVPKRHLESIGQYNTTEKKEAMDIMAKWETKGFNVYAREADSAMKSVPHQHIHLIKTDNKRAHVAFYLRKPYVLFKR